MLNLLPFRYSRRIESFVWLLGALFCAQVIQADDAALAKELEPLHLPAAFQQRILDRHLIDVYQADHYLTETELTSVSAQPEAVRSTERRGVIRIVKSTWPEAVASYRRALPEKFLPLRGYRAPILQTADTAWPAQLAPDKLNEKERNAAALIDTALAKEGLLVTLAQVLRTFDPATFQKSDPSAVNKLRELGFPVDLLAFFKATDSRKTIFGEAWISHIADKLATGQSVESLRPKLLAATFAFQPSHPRFAAASDSGELPIELFRVQAGGGYKEGIVPGGSLDFTRQLIEAMPDAKFVASIEAEYFEVLRWLAAHVWPLRRQNQLTLMVEPLKVSAWTQDNGKAGRIAGSGSSPAQHAVITPRYASLGEGKSEFIANESFLMEGVQAAGLTVVHSPLLFQGGNLLVTTNPKTGQRILLLGEGEVARNITLGLTREQAIAAFCVEFGVAECAVMPAGSYHLDYDVSVRKQNGELIAFVNDMPTTARQIIPLGFVALKQGHHLSAEEANKAEALLDKGDFEKLAELLTSVLQRHQNAKGELSTTVARSFTVSPMDSATLNYQCFVLALDLVASEAAGSIKDTRDQYLAALQRLQSGLLAQRAELTKLGFKVVPIPSLPDMHRNINYLNGIHDADAFLMPAFGGFYAPLDAAASTAIQKALGNQVAIKLLYCAESQKQHGAIHCLVSAFPQLETPTK